MNKIIGWKEFEAEWPQIKKDILATGIWGELRTTEFYEEFAKEIDKDGIDEDIRFWEEIKKNHRDDFKIRTECQNIIRELTEEREENLWKVKACLECGLRLKKSLEKEKSKVNQSSLPG